MLCKSSISFGVFGVHKEVLGDVSVLVPHRDDAVSAWFVEKRERMGNRIANLVAGIPVGFLYVGNAIYLIPNGKDRGQHAGFSAVRLKPPVEVECERSSKKYGGTGKKRLSK